MAAGEVRLFSQSLQNILMAGDSVFNFNPSSPNSLMIGIVNNSYVPDFTVASPHFRGAGGVNVGNKQVSQNGNYPDMGVVLPVDARGVYYSDRKVTLKLGGTTTTTIAQHASNPTGARWGIIYDPNTSLWMNAAIAVVDLGGVINMQNTDLHITLLDSTFTFDLSGDFT